MSDAPLGNARSENAVEHEARERERLLKSDAVGDIAAILVGCSDDRTAVQTILEKIRRLAGGEREAHSGPVDDPDWTPTLEESVAQEAHSDLTVWQFFAVLPAVSTSYGAY
jgi:hypothetical protein